jgi:acetone carboxylase gamma subunit
MTSGSWQRTCASGKVRLATCECGHSCIAQRTLVICTADRAERSTNGRFEDSKPKRRQIYVKICIEAICFSQKQT